ncbi:hypothetical protein DFJ74DRAFT_604379 [Hyaloraphidium curvatum]|nr:hypothetical protein DFJ74DRAFT_604379 [Hyaloraphidium curvatum]
MVPAANAEAIYNYTVMHPNYTSWGVVFEITTTPLGAPDYRYQVWFNTSQTGNGSDLYGPGAFAFAKMMDQSISKRLSIAAGIPTPRFDVTLKDWPRIPPNSTNDSIVQQLGTTFFFCAAMVVFINILNTIVAEKEQRLRHAMEVMGLSPHIYWLSYFITYMIAIAVAALVTCVFGLAFGFQAFRNCNFGVLYITFFLFGVAMNAFAFWITTMVRKSRVAVLLGIFMFILGLLFMSFIFSNAFVGYVWWEPGTVDPAGWIVLIFIPFFNFGKIFLDITILTTGRQDLLTDSYIPGPGFPWSALYQPIPSLYLPYYGNGAQPVVPPPVQSWYWLIMNIAFYMLLMWYFDNVIPDEFGRSRPFYFFLLPSYWGFKKRPSAVGADGDGHKAWMSETLTRSSGKKTVRHPDGLEEDDDVEAEKRRALDPESEAEMRILGLRKVYRNNPFWESDKDKVALDGLYLNLQEGSLLALLGQNGAGKTTTMNILSGLTPPTAGDALIYGRSVTKEMDAIRANMGICPQHDILFNDLTAEEHIALYAGLKGVPKEEMKKLAEERLEAVRLWNVKAQRAGTYSGGMKRRLSMMISTIGDPRIIFMDEPTTGMDPVNRRHVWSFVEAFKKGRVIVLTTHSMEEADVLGDKIAIMAHGRLRAIGSSIRLKSKFGTGYRVSVVTDADEANLKRVQALMLAEAPGLKLEDDSAGALIFNLATEDMDQIPGLVNYLDSDPDGVIKAWGLSQTTLEEVGRWRTGAR